jgi:hypothetical protein
MAQSRSFKLRQADDRPNYCHEPPNSFGGLRTDISVWRFASPIVSSLSIQFLRQGRADAPLARSWDRRMHLQFAALPFRVNSSAGVGAVL